jgi:hypothetical protein
MDWKSKSIRGDKTGAGGRKQGIKATGPRDASPGEHIQNVKELGTPVTHALSRMDMPIPEQSVT